MLVSLVLMVAGGSGDALAQCIPIQSGKLKIKPAAGNARSRLAWKAKDKSLEFLIADPKVGTTTVELSTSGTVLSTLTYDSASAPAWRSSGNPIRMWKYRDADDPSPIGGIESIKSKHSQFQLKGAEGVIDLLVAPLALPIVLTVTDSSGACYVSRFYGCGSNDARLVKCKHKPQTLPAVPNLVFQSGFENETLHAYTTGGTMPCTDDLLREDLSVDRLGDWENDLEGGPFGQFHFCFGGGNRDQRSINIVPDPDDPTNLVLYGKIVEPNEIVLDDDFACNNDAQGARKGRIQAVLQDNPNLTRVDYRLRMRLGADAFNGMVAQDQLIDWMTVAEFWNNQPAENDTFRITLNLIKEAVAGAPLYFGLKSDKQDNGSKTWIDVWPGGWDASDVEVPIGEWFTLEMTVIEGNASTGRVIARMTDAAGQIHTIGDVTNWTYSPDGTPDGFKDLNPLKLYTSGALVCELKQAGVPLEIWWDDFAIGSPD
jgi:hypothetical protein